MQSYRYYLVDVFTTARFGGNALAVFPDADSLDALTMQRIARELNLSESAFVTASNVPECDYRVRFFTPQMELPMAGHPTVGTAYVLAQIGRIVGSDEQVVVHFEEGVGTIPVAVDFNADSQPDIIWMTQPVPQFGAVWDDLTVIADLLSVNVADIDTRSPVQAVSAGVPFLFVPIKDRAALAKIKVRLDVWERVLQQSDSPHIFTFTTETEYPGSTVRSRMFAPAMGIPEDPATGAASGPLGAYLLHYGISKSDTMVSEQGVDMGRPSFIHIQAAREGDTLTGMRIGGASVSIGEGQLTF